MSLTLEEKLKEAVLTKFGLTNISRKDCKLLSEDIFLKDKNYLSESTIKRFFGFLEVPLIFSPFVYNSLARYVGYGSFDNFKAACAEDSDEVDRKDL
ncbi:MAG: hypothetical protein EOP48_00535 [Sphingobacteriales bacterium]|nr:MAG: hypothetical protein EOP48_00535 [Sphingobacteriales bacterium]